MSRSREELESVILAAAATVDRWWKDAGLFAYSEDVDRRARVAEGFLQRALAALDSMSASDKRDAHVRALVDGALAQVDSPPLKWTDPILETAGEVRVAVVETVGRAATWGAAGAGVALVFLGLAWLASRRLP